MSDHSAFHVSHAARTTRWLKGTPARAFFVIMAALFPLAIAAVISNWQSIRTAERDKIELTEAAVRQSATQLAADINAIRTSLSLTATVLATEPEPGNICDRMNTLFTSIAGRNGIVAIIHDSNGRLICRTQKGLDTYNRDNARAFDSGNLALAPDLDGLLIRSESRNREMTAVALYRREELKRLLSGNIRHPQQSLTLRQGNITLALSGHPDGNEADHDGVAVTAPVGSSSVSMSLSVHEATGGTRILSLLMPLLMWLAAAFLGWLVVRWTLIEPLIALRREVADYQPGTIVNPPSTGKFTSSEIIELGEAFREMSEDVAEHEDEMREALDRQTRLTREVHHRVKNNLQIISSLISLHWRAAHEPQASNAFLSIQRRVDALAVVQRNHYAELDEQRGVRARPMMNEIATSLKTSAQIQSNSTLDIAISCDDVYLHQDIAAPIAFMTAELADLVIALETGGRLNVSLERLVDRPGHAHFTLQSPAFRRAQASQEEKVELYERVLNGLARQLRTPLGHDIELGEYHVVVPVTA